ncbi:MAG: hypothetical protein BGO06_24890 [Shinella sp. 65-6]|nr:hypothetical protein [Hyphomicrobiales bacterium]OJU98851.1 MAG: hypothetical protein BGO06_24890 [Shinella sp. 65-6]
MSAFSALPEGEDNMMWAGWPDHPDCLYPVTEYRCMSARNRPSRAIAVAAQESRRRLVAIGINCTLAATLLAALAILAL